jgi:hypothetical protein
VKVLARGGVRVEFKDGDMIVYVDADKLMAISEVDVPEMEVLRVSKSDLEKALAKAWDDVKAEAKRFNKRRKKGARK